MDSAVHDGRKESTSEDVISIDDCINAACPWSGLPVSPAALTRYHGSVVGFCNAGCRDKFDLARDMFDRLIEVGGARSLEA
jgi:hypothetical protein